MLIWVILRHPRVRHSVCTVAMAPCIGCSLREHKPQADTAEDGDDPQHNRDENQDPKLATAGVALHVRIVSCQ